MENKSLYAVPSGVSYPYHTMNLSPDITLPDKNIRSLIVLSDIHAGCQFALCPPGVKLDGGGGYTLSPSQEKLWTLWNEYFWVKWVPKVTRGEPFAVVINGDSMDGRHHKSTTQISQNIKDQILIAKQILEPIVKLCNGNFYMTRGTSVHVGEAAENEETLARELGAIPDEHDHHARDELWIQIGDCLSHIIHHIGTTGSMSYETTALMKEYAESCAEAGRWNLPTPDVVCRSHRHRYAKVEVPSEKGYGICVTTPAWQMKTPFVWRIPGGRLSTPQFGGILIRQGDEEFYTRSRVWTAERSRTVVL